MAYYSFILNMWVMGRYTEVQVQNAVTKGYITQTEADAIIATPRA
jgi:uncharacterized XkdX family phage protein